MDKQKEVIESERKPLFVRGINSNVLEAFKTMVRNKYGKIHTVYGQEIEKAMEAYLELSHTHTSGGLHVRFDPVEMPYRKLSPGEKKVSKVITHLKEREGLWQNLMDNGGALDSTIRKICGTDPRTVEKYKKQVLIKWFYELDLDDRSGEQKTL